jgi:hypothetical protein
MGVYVCVSYVYACTHTLSHVHTYTHKCRHTYTHIHTRVHSTGVAGGSRGNYGGHLRPGEGDAMAAYVQVCVCECECMCLL